jgi:hypothetical protein
VNGVAQFLELDLLFWGLLLLGCFTIRTSSEVNRVPRCLFAQLALFFFAPPEQTCCGHTEWLMLSLG